MKKETKIKIVKSLIILLILVIIILAIYLPLKLTGLLEEIDSAEKLRDVIQGGGAYSYIIFFLIQLLQVTFIPLPATLTTIAGLLAFENIWITFGLSLFAVILGSVFAYFLGYKIGRRLVFWVVGKKEAIKWEMKLKRGKYVFFLMMLFPFFPDDILCIIAGCIGMSFKFFLITNFITRPIIILTTCLFGSGSIIPFSGWGIPVWIILILIGIIAFYLGYKYQRQIENFIYKVSYKITKKEIIKYNLTSTMILSQNSINNKKYLQNHLNEQHLLKQKNKMFSLYQTTINENVKIKQKRKKIKKR